WVAQALVRTSLVGDGQRQGAVVRVTQRKLGVEHLVVHLDITEILVGLRRARRKHRSAQLKIGRFDAEREAVLVEVVPLGCDEAQPDALGVAVYQAQLEGFAYGQEVR